MTTVRARAAVLAVGLGCVLVCACGKEGPKKEGSSLQPIAETGLRTAQPEVGPNPASRPAPPAPAAASPGEASDAPPVAGSVEIKVGMLRDEFDEKTQGCVDRTDFIRGGKGRKLVEVFQTKPVGDCVKRLGERRFTLVELKVDAVEAGLVPLPTGSRGPPPNR